MFRRSPRLAIQLYLASSRKPVLCPAQPSHHDGAAGAALDTCGPPGNARKIGEQVTAAAASRPTRSCRPVAGDQGLGAPDRGPARALVADRRAPTQSHASPCDGDGLGWRSLRLRSVTSVKLLLPRTITDLPNRYSRSVRVRLSCMAAISARCHSSSGGFDWLYRPVGAQG